MRMSVTRSTISHTAIGKLIGIVFMIVVALGVSLTARAQTGSWNTIDDPRPMGAAVLRIEQICHCMITYEDPRWQADQVIDVTTMVRRDYTPPKPKVYSPRNQPFGFEQPTVFETGIASRDATRALLSSVLNAFHASGNPGRFRVAETADMLQVRPDVNSILDTRVSIADTNNDALELFEALVNAVGSARDTKVNIGTVPIALLRRTRLRLGADNEPAHVLLAKILIATGQHLSWRLLYDFGFREYALNVHPVQ